MLCIGSDDASGEAPGRDAVSTYVDSNSKEHNP